MIYEIEVKCNAVITGVIEVEADNEEDALVLAEEMAISLDEEIEWEMEPERVNAVLDTTVLEEWENGDEEDND